MEEFQNLRVRDLNHEQRWKLWHSLKAELVDSELTRTVIVHVEFRVYWEPMDFEEGWPSDHELVLATKKQILESLHDAGVGDNVESLKTSIITEVRSRRKEGE